VQLVVAAVGERPITPHGGVRDVERRTARGERDDVIEGQVSGAMARAAVAGAPVAVLATPGTQHPGAQALPGPRAVQGGYAGCGWTGVRASYSGYQRGS
jgi:hypothetical protein